jgi:hypothetical protein
MADSASSDLAIWHYVDDTGRDVIVSNRADIPAQYLARATVVDTSKSAAPASTASLHAVPASLTDALASVHAPSAALGFVAGAVVVLALRPRRRRALEAERGLGRSLVGLALRLVVIGTAVAVAGGLYLGWVMRTAGLASSSSSSSSSSSPSLLASPQDAIQAAQHAVDIANDNTKAKQRALDAIP